MNNEYFKSLNDFSANAMEAAKSLSELNSKLMEKTISLQMKAADLMVEGGMKQGQMVQETKEAKEYMAKQASLVEEYTNKFVELAQSNVALAQEAGEEYKAWVEKNMKAVDAVAKTVASKPAVRKSATKAA